MTKLILCIIQVSYINTEVDLRSFKKKKKRGGEEGQAFVFFVVFLDIEQQFWNT